MASFISSVLPSLISDIEIRSLAHPPIKLKVADLLKPADPNAPANPLLSVLKPTVIIAGPAFPKPQIIAPGGSVGPNAWKGPAIAVVGLAFVGGFAVVTTLFALGKRSGKMAVR